MDSLPKPAIWGSALLRVLLEGRGVSAGGSLQEILHHHRRLLRDDYTRLSRPSCQWRVTSRRRKASRSLSSLLSPASGPTRNLERRRCNGGRAAVRAHPQTSWCRMHATRELLETYQPNCKHGLRRSHPLSG